MCNIIVIKLYDYIITIVFFANVSFDKCEDNYNYIYSFGHKYMHNISINETIPKLLLEIME